MPRVRPHHHPCVDCGVKTECPGTWEENYDGFPEVICDEVHRRGHETLCEACYAKRNDPEPPEDDDAWSGGFAANH